MSVKFLIDDMEYKSPGVGRVRLLRMVNEAQNYMYSKPCSQTNAIDSTTGFWPTVATTAGTLKYNAPTVNYTIGGTVRALNIWRINRVLVDVSSLNNYTIKYLGEPFEFYGLNPYSDSNEKTTFAPVPVEGMVEKLENDLAYFILKSDPSTTTDVYYVDGTLEPLQLTSESLPLTVPKRWEAAIKDYVLGTIEDQNYGKSERIQRFYEFWCPQFWFEQSAGGNSSTPFTSVFV